MGGGRRGAAARHPVGLSHPGHDDSAFEHGVRDGDQIGRVDAAAGAVAQHQHALCRSPGADRWPLDDHLGRASRCCDLGHGCCGLRHGYIVRPVEPTGRTQIALFLRCESADAYTLAANDLIDGVMAIS